MSFSTIVNQLAELRAVSSILQKKDLLADFLQDDDFRQVCQYALDSRLAYKMKQLSPVKSVDSRLAGRSLSEMFSMLLDYDKATGLTKADKLFFSNVVHSTGKEAVEVINVILGRDLKCGVGLALINDVYPDTIFFWPYMRCRSYSKRNMGNIRFPAYSQLKADGLHIDIVMDFEGKVGFFSRKGNEFDFQGVLNASASNLFADKKSGVFIGEGVVLDNNGHELDRKTGNGVINKALSGSIDHEEISRIRFHLWEYVPYNAFHGKDNAVLPYRTSFANVIKACEHNDIFSPIEHQIVENLAEATAHYRDVKERKLEGLVLKNFHGTFENSNAGSKHQVKMKAVEGEEYEAEFRVVGFKLGKPGTQFCVGLGSLGYASEDGKISGFVGSGFSHEQRRTLTPENTFDKIITIRFDSLIQDKRSVEQYSLYAPRIIAFRDCEKDTADTLEYVLELVEE